jgi:ribosomal-protein-alanine N-acetyltransferase
LREFVREDAADLFVLDNDPDVMRHIASYTGVGISMAECEKNILHQQRYYKEHPGLGIWAAILKESELFIGWASLKHVDYSAEIEIGLRFQKAYWNQGYAAEIGSALIRYGFETLGLKRIVAVAKPENGATRRVLEKIGMRHGKPRQFYETDVVSYVVESLHGLPNHKSKMENGKGI